MVEEFLASCPHFGSLEAFRVTDKSADVSFGLHGATPGQGVRLIANLALIDGVPHVTVPLVIMDRGNWTVNGNFMEVWTAEAKQLGVGIGKQPSLQQRIVGKIDTRDHMAWMKGHLFRFREKVIGVPVQGEFADTAHWNK